MAAIFVRVRLEWMEEANRAGDVDTQLMFDLKIDRDTGEVLGKHPCFGINGSISREHYPCLLLLDGRIDFGDAVEGISERYWTTNLRNRFIRVGEYVSIESEAEDTYRISSVAVLGEEPNGPPM